MPLLDALDVVPLLDALDVDPLLDALDVDPLLDALVPPLLVVEPLDPLVPFVPSTAPPQPTAPTDVERRTKRKSAEASWRSMNGRYAIVVPVRRPPFA